MTAAAMQVNVVVHSILREPACHYIDELFTHLAQVLGFSSQGDAAHDANLELIGFASITVVELIGVVGHDGVASHTAMK